MTSRLFAERRSGLRKQESSGILKPLTAGPAYSRRAMSEPPTLIPHGHDFSRIPVRSPAAIQRSASEGPESEASFDTGAAVRAGESGGASLPAEVRSYFEPRFGCDLDAVRVHADGQAAEAARGVQARAYTIGRDIVFGAGEYAPATAKGRRLLAHELAHVVQQSGNSVHRQEKPAVTGAQDPAEVEADRIAEKVIAQGGAAKGLTVRQSPQAHRHALMRQPVQSPLEELPEATRANLKVDTDEDLSKPKDFFGLQGEVRFADNVDADIDIRAPMIDSLKDEKAKTVLYKGLKAYAHGVFQLLPENDGKAKAPRLNMVAIENLDLTAWGGPNTTFRFTCTGSRVKGKITVRILIEAMNLRAKPMADPVAAPGIEKTKATPYGLTRAASISDPVWEKVLRSLGRISDSLIMRVRDITFEASPQDKSPKGEDAQFLWNFKDGKWTRRILIFKNMVSSNDESFALTLAHEMGHAIDAAPAQGPKGPIAKGEVHNDPKFQEAMKKDGGRAKAITKYAATDDEEFFAECFALYIQQPDTLKALRPNIYAFFKAYDPGALQDPKLNPFYKPPGAMPTGTGLNIGPF